VITHVCSSRSLLPPPHKMAGRCIVPLNLPMTQRLNLEQMQLALGFVVQASNDTVGLVDYSVNIV
jgi:hypothetical protein